MEVQAKDQVPCVQQYYDKVIRSIWTTKLPAYIAAIGHTEPGEDKFSSVDMVQMLLRVIAREIIQQRETPCIQLLRQESPRNSGEVPRFGPKAVPIISKIIVPNPPDHSGWQDFENKLSNGYFPRACIQFRMCDWHKDVEAEEAAMKANAGYQLCLAAIVSQIH